MRHRGAAGVICTGSTGVGKIDMAMEGIRLVWKDSFNSGHALIDKQHRGLFELANELLDAMHAAAPRDEVLKVVDRLLHDIARHFADEEELLERAGYLSLYEHSREHAALVGKARMLADAFRQGTLHIRELFQFLAYDVVTRHMLGTDRHFFPYINDQP